eukprot:364479-Chlamydomonas_euryale.AAC.9
MSWPLRCKGGGRAAAALSAMKRRRAGDGCRLKPRHSSSKPCAKHTSGPPDTVNRRKSMGQAVRDDSSVVVAGADAAAGPRVLAALLDNPRRKELPIHQWP